jgi:PAS domain S-box-containing protein
MCSSGPYRPAANADNNDVRSPVVDGARRDQLLAAALRAAGCGIAIVDRNGIIVEVNGAYASMLGYRPDELVGHPIERFTHPGEVEATKELREGALQGGASRRLEKRYLHRNGATVWGRVNLSLLPGGADQEPFVVGVIENIDDLKRAEADLRASEARTQSLVEGARYAVVSMCAGGKITSWSENATAIFGWTAEEAIGRSLPETILPAPLHEAYERGMARHLEHGDGTIIGHRLELTAVRRDGAEIPIELAITPTGQPNASGFSAFVRDLSERRRAEQALRQSEGRFRTLIENIPGAVYRCGNDSDWTMELISDDITEITGYPASDFLGNCIRSYGNVIHPNDSAGVAAAVDAAVQARKPFICEYRVVRSDGAERWVYEKGQPVFGSDGSVRWLDGVIFDVTDRKVAEAERDGLLAAERAARAEAEAAREQLEAQNDELRKLDRLKDEFVALVSHELRTPLTSIMGYLDLVAAGEAGPVTDNQTRFLEVASRNASRLLTVVGDLLFIAQVDAGRLDLDLGLVDLGGVAQDSVEAARLAAAARGVTIGLEAAGSTYLRGDRLRLAQLLDNLVSNAIKFTPHGGCVTVAVSLAGGEARVTVSDTGIGIAEDEQAQLFEPFFRASGAQRLAVPGTGLGLTISKAIVEAHGGTIAVDSREGEGTTFTLVLPTRGGELRRVA